jgi:hypothetical protein
LAALQTPELPVVSEAEHAMHLSVQALLQQTPSAQKPDEHSVVAAQESPSIFLAAHLLVVALQYEVVGQSLSVVQAVRQPSTTSQAAVPQSCVPTVLHAPLPSQAEMGVKAAPLHEAVVHTWSVPTLRQAPTPSHVPSLPH